MRSAAMLERRSALFALPFIAVGGALLVDLAFGDQLEPHRYAPFLFAVIITAFAGGLAPSLTATILAVASMNAFDYMSHGELRLDADDFVQLVIFVSVALCISFLTTRRQRAERELERANRELRALDHAKDQFIAAVSHELRTPMTVIQGWAAILRRENDDQLREVAVEAIEQSAHAQARLIEDLLDLSRLTLGKLHLEMAPVAMATVVGQTVAMIRPQADSKHIALNLTLPRDPCVVQGDPLRVQQICWNLLSNAVKFTPEGGHVEVVLSRQDRTVRMCVRDDGDGIAAEVLPRIFEPFRQGNGAAAKGGLGLGLAIVRQLVKMHRGEVEAQSDGVGKGAQFVVRLPAVRE
jgi:signal transduction histidine kinase